MIADYDRVLRGDSEVRTPDLFGSGRLVARLCARRLDAAAIEAARAWAGIEAVERPSLSRRAAAGELDPDAFGVLRDDVVGVERVSATSGRLVLRDGRVLRQVVSNPVRSYVAGFTVSRYGNRAQPGRLTRRHPDRWVRSLPFFGAVDALMRAEFPDVHTRHTERVRRHPRWIIPGTSLSTVAVNVNYASHPHLDVGDFTDGLSTVSVVELGAYAGGLLVFPQHRVAFDVREGDVLFMRAHVDVHCNTPVVGPGTRLSFVTYLKHGLADTVNARETA